MVKTCVSRDVDEFFLLYLTGFHKHWRSPNRVKLSCGSLSQSFSLSAFHTPGWIWRNHPVLIGLWGRRPNRRSVLRGLDWLRLIPQLRQRLQMAPFVALEKGREERRTYRHSHCVHLLVLERAHVRGWTWPFMNANTMRSWCQIKYWLRLHFRGFVAPNVSKTIGDKCLVGAMFSRCRI